MEETVIDSTPAINTSGVYLPTPRLEDSVEMTTSELRSSSMLAQASSRIASLHMDDVQWIQYLKIWILKIKHQAKGGEELASFPNSETDNIVEFIKAVESRSITRGFVTSGREISGFCRELQKF